MIAGSAPLVFGMVWGARFQGLGLFGVGVAGFGRVLGRYCVNKKSFRGLGL